MNITIHSGSKEIGGSCVEVESQGKWLLIDLGLPLTLSNDALHRFTGI
jgi:ribonuclease J